MRLIDSHSHLFLEEFVDDLPAVMDRAVEAGLSHIFMPNIDSTTLKPLLKVCSEYPQCYPMIGLHPTSVNAQYQQELDLVYEQLQQPQHDFVAVGEIGLDLYWDQTFLPEQLVVFEQQVKWALDAHLPIVVHSRNAFDYIYKVLAPYKNSGLTGIFHSFTGDAQEAAALLEFPGFLLGINGVLTFKKSTLPAVLKEIPLERLVLETDSPYLTPVPNRGKRNESAYVRYTAAKVAEIYGVSVEDVAEVTSNNALNVFRMVK